MSQPTTRSRSSQFVLGVVAALTLAVVIIGVPLLLAGLGGDPLPRHVGSWSSLRDDLLHKDATGTLFIRLLVIVGWLAWASFALSIVVETVARLRGRAAARLPGLGGPQRWAAGLITAIALTITAPAAGFASPHAPVAAVARHLARSGAGRGSGRRPARGRASGHASGRYACEPGDRDSGRPSGVQGPQR